MTTRIALVQPTPPNGFGANHQCSICLQTSEEILKVGRKYVQLEEKHTFCKPLLKTYSYLFILGL